MSEVQRVSRRGFLGSIFSAGALILAARVLPMQAPGALAAADAAATPMPLASLIREHFLAAIAHGQGGMDWAGLARVIAENAGLGEPNAMPHAMAH
jgi:hypothetical protein